MKTDTCEAEKGDKVCSIMQIIHNIASPSVYLVNKLHALWLRQGSKMNLRG